MFDDKNPKTLSFSLSIKAAGTSPEKKKKKLDQYMIKDGRSLFGRTYNNKCQRIKSRVKKDERDLESEWR